MNRHEISTATNTQILKALQNQDVQILDRAQAWSGVEWEIETILDRLDDPEDSVPPSLVGHILHRGAMRLGDGTILCRRPVRNLGWTWLVLDPQTRTWRRVWEN